MLRENNDTYAVLTHAVTYAVLTYADVCWRWRMLMLADVSCLWSSHVTRRCASHLLQRVPTTSDARCASHARITSMIPAREEHGQHTSQQDIESHAKRTSFYLPYLYWISDTVRCIWIAWEGHDIFLDQRRHLHTRLYFSILDTRRHPWLANFYCLQCQVLCSNNFLLWHYCLFVPWQKSSRPNGRLEKNLWFLEMNVGSRRNTMSDAVECSHGFP